VKQLQFKDKLHHLLYYNERLIRLWKYLQCQ